MLFITANSDIRKTVLHVKSETWRMVNCNLVIWCVEVCRRKPLINDAHPSISWLSKCKQRTQLFACSVISQQWQILFLRLSPNLSLSSSSQQDSSLPWTASADRKVRIYITWSNLLANTSHRIPALIVLFISVFMASWSPCRERHWVTLISPCMGGGGELSEHDWVQGHLLERPGSPSSILHIKNGSQNWWKVAAGENHKALPSVLEDFPTDSDNRYNLLFGKLWIVFQQFGGFDFRANTSLLLQNAPDGFVERKKKKQL